MRPDIPRGRCLGPAPPDPGHPVSQVDRAWEIRGRSDCDIRWCYDGGKAEAGCEALETDSRRNDRGGDSVERRGLGRGGGWGRGRRRRRARDDAKKVRRRRESNSQSKREIHLTYLRCRTATARQESESGIEKGPSVSKHFRSSPHTFRNVWHVGAFRMAEVASSLCALVTAVVLPDIAPQHTMSTQESDVVMLTKPVRFRKTSLSLPALRYECSDRSRSYVGTIRGSEDSEREGQWGPIHRQNAIILG
ncbi:hypothetical protein AXG93_4831s1260 [Marchantia polymorpha subsp. ruderalis]|uniref:Uncharacterized protein n=1 Tax=Marchantia polymorpha subsp. ruderalis TaxID=1480154 RepID=A0A176WB89_MARPO|nr:hypothetical protein AXG93_4831s1260 [Marchantia polymorpha subsp. ruderalis]